MSVENLQATELNIVADGFAQGHEEAEAAPLVPATSIAGILYAIPVESIVSAGLGLGWTVKSIYKGGLCGQKQ